MHPLKDLLDLWSFRGARDYFTCGDYERHCPGEQRGGRNASWNP